jgi:5-(carboxyamino)imidazole ribonucleotide synthase
MKPLSTGSTIGILGGGQLGRMTAEAAAKMGFGCQIFAQEADEPACLVTKNPTLGDFKNEAKLVEFADKCDVITLEWENVPVESLEFLARLKPVRPNDAVLRVTQDRINEKSCARELGLGVPDFRALKTQDDAKRAAVELKTPCIFKTARMGYDGKGQAQVKTPADVETAWASLKTDHAIAEAFVPFEKEISVIIARGSDGTMQAFPAVENRHKNGILDETDAPAAISAAVAGEASRMAHMLAEKLGVIGLLAVEMFVVGNGVLMNEMAPRPHNSGHWSMDFCETSQFEQLVRAICGLPLGPTGIKVPARMKNLIGDDVNHLDAYKDKPDTFIHLYGKKEAREGRKMGHVNFKSVSG